MKLFFATFLLTIIMTTTLKAEDMNMILHYLVREPKIKSGKPPVLILLHGVGSNEEDLFSFADQLPGKFLVISARAPNTLGKGSYAWYPVDFTATKPVINFEEEEKSRNILIKFVHQVKEKFVVDEKQVYLCGFSQGAIMSYSVALTHPELIAGIAVMSGRLLEEIKPLIASKDKLQSLRIFISHGTNDNTLQIHYARESVAFLKSLNLNPEYKEYIESHGINMDMLTDLIQWLNKE